jgi:hypothetical protein
MTDIINKYFGIKSAQLIYSNKRIKESVKSIVLELISSETFDQCDDLFIELDILHSQLSKNVFISNTEIDEYLNEFLTIWERCYDKDYLKLIYSDIKSKNVLILDLVG